MKEIEIPRTEKRSIPPRVRKLAIQNLFSTGLMITGLALTGSVGWGIFGAGTVVEAKSWFDFFRPSPSRRRVQTV